MFHRKFDYSSLNLSCKHNFNYTQVITIYAEKQFKTLNKNLHKK